MKSSSKHSKKLIAKSSLVAMTLTVGGLLVSSMIHATPISGTNGGGGEDPIVQAIEALGAQINALAVAGANSLSDAVYQFDQDLPGIVQTNSANSTLGPQTVASTTTQTLADIKSSLQVFPQQVIPPKTTPVNQVQAMTYGIPSSDTLYSPNDPQIAVFNSNPQAMPDNDDYFTVDSLLGPDAYTQDQQNAAQYYVNFITQSYNPLGSTLNLAPLASLSYASFLNFQRNNLVYQNYQAGVRSYTAMNSLALSNYNLLMTERTVQSGLGTTVGLTVPSSSGLQPVADASPLQVQEFMATRRINNVQWYKDMAAASPATVQRESLYVLAEIEAQLWQQHLDSERMIATLSAMELGSSMTLRNQLQIQESSVNSAVQAAASSDSASSSAASAAVSTNTANAATNYAGTGNTAQIPNSNYNPNATGSSGTGNTAKLPQSQ